MSLRIIGICGSMRPKSVTASVLTYALEIAKATGAETEFYDISEHTLPFVDGRNDESTYPPSVQEFKNLVRRAQGIIIATPEYHNSYTGSLKNALDFCGHAEFEHKMCGIIGVAGGGMGAGSAIGHLRTVMRGVGAWVIPNQVSILNSGKLFTADGEIADELLAKRIQKLAADVAKYAKLFAAGLLDLDE